MTFRIVVALLFVNSFAWGQEDRPVPAKEAPKRMTMPEGFHVTLFAGEPDVVQPIAFTFDDRGRLWVIECLSYPKWAADGTGKDRVTMFEDTNGDGQFDKRRVVWDKGSNLTGIELGYGGVWLLSLPNVLFVPCDFNADAPVFAKPEVVLDGWSLQCKHNAFSSLTWGPDGWLYGCNGITATSKVGVPGTPDNQRTLMNCGVWRYHPQTKKFEVFANGTTNPWGLDFDEFGELFITNCVIHHLWHVVPGAHFERMFGQDLTEHVYSLMPSCADHIHWGGGHWTSSRSGKGLHSEAGGGHAHSGCMVYLGDNWPAKYHNGVFTCNIHGNRINHDRLVRSGSGYIARHEPDPLHANDPWFRGLVVKYGPDGGVYISDWCDTGECHNYDKADMTNGRVYKATFGKIKGWSGDLSTMTNDELVGLLIAKNHWLRNHARRLLEERSLAKKVDLTKIIVAFQKLKVTTESERLSVLWTQRQLGLMDDGALLKEITHADASMRSWVIRLAVDFGNPSDAIVDAILTQAKQEKSPVVRLALASAMQRMPKKARLALAAVLLSHSEDADDPAIPRMIWYGVEPAVVEYPKDGVALLAHARVPLVREFITRRLVNLNTSHFEALVALAAQSKNAETQRDVLAGMQDALAGRRGLKALPGWATHSTTLLRSQSAEVRQRATLLGVQFGDRKLIDQLQKSLVDAKIPVQDREIALRSLVQRGDATIVPTVKTLLQDATMRGSAIRALAAFRDEETPTLLMQHFAKATAAEKDDIVQTLASRSAWALVLLDAVEAGKVARTDISVFVARQIFEMKDAKVTAKLTKAWGQIKPVSEERTALTKKYKELLTADFLKTADHSKGRALYVKNCAACHRLYDDGGTIGPALTGAQRHNLDYVLENVIDPSAVVAREYQMTKIVTDAGRILNGIIRTETDKALTVQLPTEMIVLPKDAVTKRDQLTLSMMPEGILDKLTKEEIRDLIAYLQTKDQVPLPK